MPAAQIDPSIRVETLIAMTEELTAIFVKENTALTARRPGELAPLQADKARLAAAYAQSIRAIAADRGLVAGAGDDLMRRLRTITLDFETRASEQRALLDGARQAAEGVLRAVAAEAGATGRSPAYNRPQTAGDAPTAAPLAINEKA
ncbi:MAG: hypothetical protein RIC52_02060 [Amphiplicatus sp.]